MTDATARDKPFIIWTVQRTGGTNLTKSLVKLSSYAIEQEPFNRPRMYGHITKAWDQNRDPDALRAAVQETTTGAHNVKHCVETIPWEVSEAILRSTNISIYNHLFLVREDSLPRLLSMEYAKRTNVWGPTHEAPDREADPAFETPLNVAQLLKHETMSIERLNRAWDSLLTSG